MSPYGLPQHAQSAQYLGEPNRLQDTYMQDLAKGQVETHDPLPRHLCSSNDMLEKLDSVLHPLLA